MTFSLSRNYKGVMQRDPLGLWKELLPSETQLWPPPSSPDFLLNGNADALLVNQ